MRRLITTFAFAIWMALMGACVFGWIRSQRYEDALSFASVSESHSPVEETHRYYCLLTRSNGPLLSVSVQRYPHEAFYDSTGNRGWHYESQRKQMGFQEPDWFWEMTGGFGSSYGLNVGIPWWSLVLTVLVIPSGLLLFRRRRSRGGFPVTHLPPAPSSEA